MTLAAAITGAVMVSFSAILFQLSDANAVTGSFFRAAYAVPALLIFWLVQKGDDRRAPRLRWLAFGAGISLGIDVVLWHSAINFIGTGLATLLANSQVVIVAIAAWVLQGERPTRRVLIAIPIVLFGIALISGVGQDDAFGTDPLLGALLAIVAAFFYSAFLLGYRASNTGSGPTSGALLEATVGAAVASLIIGLVSGELVLTPTWPGHGWLLALALGAQVVAWLMIGYALPRLPAVETSTIILIQPAMTMVWGALIFGERPSAIQLVGAVLVLVGVGMVALARARATAAVAEASA